jgi:hypothetical protein
MGQRHISNRSVAELVVNQGGRIYSPAPRSKYWFFKVDSKSSNLTTQVGNKVQNTDKMQIQIKTDKITATEDYKQIKNDMHKTN